MSNGAKCGKELSPGPAAKQRPTSTPLNPRRANLLAFDIVFARTSVQAADNRKADNNKTEEPLDVFSKILKVNTGMENNTHPIVHGDIIKRMGRYATNCDTCLWPKSADGTVQVPYTLSPKYSADDNNLFMTAMQEFESLTCVRFVNRTQEVNFLNISSSDGCSSYVGQNGGSQPVFLSPGCIYRGIIQHELNHALGFLHENSRSDRNKYITVNYQNVIPGKEINFNIQDGTTLGLPYDYTSVMHYGKFAFTINSSLPTITPIPDPNVSIGQIDGLSVLDVAKINKRYNCNVSSRLLNTPEGDFSSTNYPSNYPDNMNYVFLIRTPDGQVALTFNDFDLQISPNCTSDHIRIYDGPSRRAPILLNNTCGTSQIPTVIGSTNQMLMEFVSDAAISSRGFSASYNTGEEQGNGVYSQGNLNGNIGRNFYSEDNDDLYD
ncbi:embryonic protein UVS.2-like [Bufo bufo]|uniref:embryonic protein UVS.2-like n=1 Tax=Bufo bufo TaxID=8384 RepID=UPI001ABD9F44|nr:embryonic protein UVS.2-like [Bufo bufo]